LTGVNFSQQMGQQEFFSSMMLSSGSFVFIPYFMDKSKTAIKIEQQVDDI
jgi:hypothetical protein